MKLNLINPITGWKATPRKENRMKKRLREQEQLKKWNQIIKSE